jgi:hypothetical protein
MSILTGGSPFHDLIGIAAGHTYIFLKMTLPVSHGYDLIKTPKFIERIVNEIIRRTQAAGIGNSRVFNLGGDRLNPNAGRVGGGAGD